MKIIKEWHPRLICKSCGWHTECPKAEIYHVDTPICRACGTWLKIVKQRGLDEINDEYAIIHSMMLAKKGGYFSSSVWYIKLDNSQKPTEYDPSLLKLIDKW